MSFLSEVSASQKIGAVIVALVLGFAARAFTAGGVEEYLFPAKRVENRIEEALAAHPGNLAVLGAMQTHFPDEYDDMLDAMADSAIADAADDQVLAVGTAQLGAFLHRHRNDFANAPDAALADVLHRSSEALSALYRDDPVACNNFAYGRNDPVKPLPPATQALLGEAIAARVRAMAAGRTQQTVRLHVTPTDLAALESGMREAGASAGQLALFFGATSDPSLSAGGACEAMILLHAAIAAQEAGTRELLAAHLLAPA